MQVDHRMKRGWWMPPAGPHGLMPIIRGATPIVPGHLKNYTPLPLRPWTGIRIGYVDSSCRGWPGAENSQFPEKRDSCVVSSSTTCTIVQSYIRFCRRVGEESGSEGEFGFGVRNMLDGPR